MVYPKWVFAGCLLFHSLPLISHGTPQKRFKPLPWNFNMCSHRLFAFNFGQKKQFFSLSYFLNIKFSDFISLECSFTTTQKQHNKNQLIAKWLRKLLRHCFDWGFLCLILIIRLWRTHLTCLDGNYNISLTFDHHNCPETHLNYTDIWCGKCGGTQLSWGKPYLRMLSW